MAKSARSKVKRAFRAKKRTDGVYAAAEAARLQRLNAKLRALTTTATTGEGGEKEEDVDTEFPVDDADADADADAEMSSPTTIAEGVDGKASEKPAGKKISTHGPRGSRREQWRASKGMEPRPKSRGMNRQGTVASRYKSGRSHRRR